MRTKPSITPRELWEFALACFFLATAKLCITTLPFRIVTRLYRLDRKQVTPITETEPVSKLPFSIIAIKRAARRLPGSYMCLPQALAGKVMLRLRGVPSILILGVKIGSEKNLKAHAWLVSENRILLGGDVSAFERVGEFE